MSTSKIVCFCFLSFLFSLLLTPQLHSEELKEWPRDVKVSSGSITIYQPQVESLEDNILKGRAAIAYHGQGEGPVFGAVWFTARVEIDRASRTVHCQTLEITGTRFPKENKELEEEFSEAVKQGVEKGDLTSSLDELTTALAAVEQEQEQAADIKNDPPEIIYSEKPTLLIIIDGKAMLQKIEKSEYQAVANTPYPLFSDAKSKTWYLNAAEKVWYQAQSVDGPWSFDENPPTQLVEMVASQAKQFDEKSEESSAVITAANAPLIIVAHKPTELVVSDGKADFSPVTDDLLAMSNTDAELFMDVNSQNYFLVISGRWYRSKSMDGKWQYVSSDKLPSSFTDIPKGSSYAEVRSYVAGTDEAKEAVMDAQIPQTASVQRGEVDIEVTYDGKPKFQEIAGTDLHFAVNCSETVIEAGRNFYLVKDAVWYIADSANGPWSVSDHAPSGIDKVPPSSPVYNVKYVYVYDSTPEVVYVGYTPGYVGSYIYGPTIVYGTGWYYSPWVSPYYYYPRPVTWGFSVAYNPWTGWGFGMSWSSGPFRVGFYTGGGYHGRYWGGSRCWGPRGYRRSYHQVNIKNININNSRKFNTISNRNNLYRNSTQRATIQGTMNSRSISNSDRQNIQNRVSQKQARAGAVNNQNRKNNVLADGKGNVLRNNNGQWQQRDQGQWQNKATPAITAKPRSNVQQRTGYDRSSSYDRQQFSRQRATERSRQYNRPSGASQRRSGASRSGGGNRGGGARRR